MARATVYQRFVNAVHNNIQTGKIPCTETLEGVRIKEESADATMNTRTIDDNKYLRSRSKRLVSDKSLFPEKNYVLREHVNFKTQEHAFDNCSEDSESVELTNVNIKRKSTKSIKEHMCDTSPTLKKKRKYSDEICAKNAKRRKRRVGSKLNITYRTRRPRRKKDQSECDVCFVVFKNQRNRNLHQSYFMAPGNFKCTFCKRHCSTQAKLHSHIILNHRKDSESRQKLYCNYCIRTFKRKELLQSHLFHAHHELIYPNTVTETNNYKNVLKSTSHESDVSRNDVHEESLRSSSLNEFKTFNVSLINKDCKHPRESDKLKANNSVEELSSEETLTTKRLRQPTLNEYLELCKRKHDNKIDVKQTYKSSSTCISDRSKEVEEYLKSKSREAIYNVQIDTSIERSNSNVEETTHASTLEQSKNLEECPTKEPFVKLHADVEMMKCFLENLPDTNIKNKVAQDHTYNSVSYDHDIPYSLRPTRAIRSLGYLSKRLFRKSQPNIKYNTETEQHVTDLKKIDSNSSKTATYHLKDCTVILRRCDALLRNHPVSTTQAIYEDSSITESNSTRSQKSDRLKINVVFKEVEISLKRLETEDNLEAESNIEKQDNCFICGVCQRNFPTKSSKRIHIKSSHVAYMSSICNARYTMKHKLLQHYLREHTFKVNQCCVCHKSVSDSNELKQHLIYHCLKYFQNKDDQYPINIDIKCSVSGSYPCYKCGIIFVSHLEWTVHDRYCLGKREASEVDKDSTKKTHTNISSEITPETNFNEDYHKKNTIIRDRNIQRDTLRQEIPDSKLVERLDEDGKMLTTETLKNKKEELEIIEEPNIIEEDLEINENGENSFGRKAIFIVENVGNINESQKSIDLPKTDDFTTNDQDIGNTQSNTIKSNETYLRNLIFEESNEESMRVKSGSQVGYPCDICGKRFQNQKNLEQHTRSFSRVTDFCPICNTAFSSKRFLQTHIAAAHVPQLSKNYDFHCVFCNQGFVKKYDLRPHVLHLHGRQMLETIMPNFPSRGKYESDSGNATCSVCNLAFETFDRYMEHTMYYYKDHKFRCTICSLDFQGMYMFHHHNKLTHYPEDKRKSYIYTCKTCSEGFNHEMHFYSHRMHIHSNQESSTEIRQSLGYIPSIINMEEDGEVIDLSMNRQRNIQRSSTNYTCQICQYKGIDANDLKRHEFLYSNDGDFKCNLCNRKCKTQNLLEQHRSLTHTHRHDNNKYVCYDCGEVLVSVNSLKFHEKHFHFNSVSYNYGNNCKICGGTFSLSTKCKTHQCESKKTEEKYVYRCFYCDLKFNSLEAIQTHIINVHFKLTGKHTVYKPEFTTNDKVMNMSIQFINDDQIQNKTIPQLVDQVLISRKSVAQSFQQTDNIPNKTLAATQETQDKIAVEPTAETLKALFLIDNETKQKTTVTSSINNRSESTTMKANIPTIMKKEQNNSTESTSVLKNNHSEFLSNSVNISLEQMLDGTSIFSTTRSDCKSKIIFTTVSSTLSSGSSVPIMVPPPPEEAIPLEKCVSVNSNTEYVCPLCSLQYPSLMFFHAHLRYVHIDLIRNDLVYPQLDQLAEKIPAIECLLCPHISTDEQKYKRHLRHSHSSHMHFTNFKGTKKISDASNSLMTQTTSNTRSKTPEVITLEDDDDDDDNDNDNDSNKNTLIKSTAAETVKENTHIPNTENENIGKLKVKPFAKIIENLAMDRALELLNKY